MFRGARSEKVKVFRRRRTGEKIRRRTRGTSCPAALEASRRNQRGCGQRTTAFHQPQETAMKTSFQTHPTLTPARDLLGQLQQIQRRIDHRQPAAAEHLGDAAQALETLPLDSDEFALARNRLCNAAAYLDQGQWGAASYEVKLVLGWLKSFIRRYAAAPSIP
jgi:hypothetical protein